MAIWSSGSMTHHMLPSSVSAPLLLEVGADEVGDEAPPGQRLRDAEADQRQRSGAYRRRPERGGHLGSGSHGREGSTGPG